MHQQIRFVIDRLQWFPGQVVLVELSAPEQTPLGKLVGRLYYDTNAMEVVDRDCRWGYPHNGGMHTFTYKGPARDAVAMLEVFKEALEGRLARTEEERQVCSEFSYISQEILAGRKKM